MAGLTPEARDALASIEELEAILGSRGHELTLSYNTPTAEFVARPERVDLEGTAWCVVGEGLWSTQIVRFGDATTCYSLELFRTPAEVRSKLVAVAALIASRVSAASESSPLMSFCTAEDASELFGAPAFVHFWHDDEIIRWRSAACVVPVRRHTLFLQCRPSDRPEREPQPRRSTSGSAEALWNQGGVHYRLSHSSRPDVVFPFEPVVAIAERISDRLRR